jgi:hypothetical protein
MIISSSAPEKFEITLTHEPHGFRMKANWHFLYNKKIKSAMANFST